MRSFTQLILRLNDLQTEAKIIATLESYFRVASAEDGTWALWLLLGNKLKPAISRPTLKRWIADITGYPDWLVQESARHVGNIPETFSLMAGNFSRQALEIPLGTLIQDQLLPLKDWDSYFQKQMLEKLWSEMSQDQLSILLQILSGSLRTNCSNFQIVRALANILDVDFPVLLHRLQQSWLPDEAFYNSLTDPGANQAARETCPYPIREAGSLQASLVLVYAYVNGIGDQADFSTYALAAAKGDDLVPVARIPSGLDANEKPSVDAWIRDNTLMKKGPVRTTPGKLVIRIAFDGAYASKRHKCGLVLDNPVMLAWEKDASIKQLTRFDELQSLANQEAPLT